MPLFWAISIQFMATTQHFKFYFNIILPSMPRFSKWAPSFRLPRVHLSMPSCLLHVPPITSHNIRQKLKTKSLSIAKYLSVSCCGQEGSSVHIPYLHHVLWSTMHSLVMQCLYSADSSTAISCVFHCRPIRNLHFSEEMFLKVFLL